MKIPKRHPGLCLYLQHSFVIILLGTFVVRTASSLGSACECVCVRLLLIQCERCVNTNIFGFFPNFCMRNRTQTVGLWCSVIVISRLRGLLGKGG